jgi:hypothetical protein
VRQQLVDWIMAHALRHNCDEEVRRARARAGACTPTSLLAWAV